MAPCICLFLFTCCLLLPLLLLLGLSWESIVPGALRVFWGGPDSALLVSMSSRIGLSQMGKQIIIQSINQSIGIRHFILGTRHNGA